MSYIQKVKNEVSNIRLSIWNIFFKIRRKTENFTLCDVRKLNQDDFNNYLKEIIKEADNLKKYLMEEKRFYDKHFVVKEEEDINE
ncbi:MAG: hypothetical protein A2086_13445 [Spirochaetes bacterium GWD1_27_9]|nr:MAG: hypothetical protein A2Z98_02080 [Spirochaetes bacterium GWB1_27_13]OHD23099.1 MAG: hypothetical protein A2Y34_16930 [Spirochaetes bacterium GWC1_27_15]OHD39911.1 MAG: hypothetical protein A2086_13445 [Spirochaetes bacterium GWD1_27_9]